jgi:hypothetical protein
MTMIHTLFALLDMLTDFQAMTALTRELLTFGLFNAGMALLLGSFEIVRRSKCRQTIAVPSRAWKFEDLRRHSI